MTNYSTGHQAEGKAADYLERHGYKLVDKNWKTKYCEIDLVAKKGKVIHFIEVKYRTSKFQGSGYEYVNRKKLNRMKFAAEMWVTNHQWVEEVEMGVISIDGEEISYFSAVD